MPHRRTGRAGRVAACDDPTVITIRPTGERFGAYVEGADLTAVPDGATHAQLQAALDEHLVLVFRDHATPTDAQVVAFCRAFGPLRPSLADQSRLPEWPEINLVGNRARGPVQASGGAGALHYHSDLHHEPPLIEFIYLDAVEVPTEGGDTFWVDLRAAYDALPAERRAFLDDLVVHYGLRHDLDFDTYFKASSTALAARRQHTEVSLVQTNPRTGRRSLWANTGPQSNHAPHVVGMDPDTSRELLLELFDFCTQERFRVTHSWRTGEACLWHNIQTLHGRAAFPDEQVRMMRHVNILGVRDPHQES
jgi:alpha-ketoglutarate-dependent taurine dioxygenase